MKHPTQLLTYLGRHKKAFLFSGVFSCFYGLFSAAPAYALQYLVDLILIAKKTSLLLPFIFIFAGLFIGKAISMYFATYLLQRTGYRIVNNIRQDLFSSILAFPLSFFKKHSTGELMSRFLHDMNTLQFAASVSVRNGIRSLIEALSLLTIALYQNVLLTSISLIMAPLIVTTIRYTGKRIKRASQITQDNMSMLSSSLQQSLVGIRSIKAFNGEDAERNRFTHLLHTYFSSMMTCVHYEAFGPPLVELIAMAGCSCVLFVAAHQVINHIITPGQLTSLFTAMFLAYQPIKRAISVYGEITYGVGATTRIFEILNEGTIPHEKNSLPIPAPQKTIRFQDVSFAYQKNHPILRHATITVSVGERIAIIGASGVGKSTFSDLLLRFITPQQGALYFDDTPLEKYTARSIRSHIGYVGQHPFLFNDTIYANILYGNPSATEQDVLSASKQAHAHEFIIKLPEQYMTRVGEDGDLLSGGQRQRITIARALIKKPAILLFDEATSALDTAAENGIAQTIESLDSSMTVIIITHRPRLLQSVHRIVTIEKYQFKETTNVQRDHREKSRHKKA